MRHSLSPTPFETVRTRAVCVGRDDVEVVGGVMLFIVTSKIAGATITPKLLRRGRRIEVGVSVEIASARARVGQSGDGGE